MTKYKIEDGTIVDVTEYSQESIDFFLTQYPEAELVQEEETQDFQNGAAEKDADVVPVATPSRASIISGVQPKDTESPSVDISSELEDPDPDKPLSASEKRIATRKRREQEKQDGLKAEAITATNEIEARIESIPKEDIVTIQANEYFGPVKTRSDRTTVSKTMVGMMGPTVSFEPTFDSDESYTKYLKETLGVKYDQYLDYKETNNIVPLNTQNESQLKGIYDDAETKAKDKVYNNSLFNVSEDVQEYMVASPKFASGAETVEAQKFNLKVLNESVDQNLKNYKDALKEWESQAIPLNKEAEDIKTQIDRFTFYYDGASQEQADQYNELIQAYNSKIQQWEEKGFNELPVFVNSQAKLVNSQQKDYSKMLEDSRKALVDSDLFEKNLKQDYSASARVGRVFDEFFVQSTRNFADLTAELGLKGAKAAGMAGFQPLAFLTSPGNSAIVDSVIETIQKNNKNYNLSMASKRESIPTSPSIDDIGKDGLSVWDWTSIALQDNSATIATTFVPGLASLKGASGVKAAFKTASYTARKKALQNQKKLWLAGKRTVQGTFFVAETGGKYGELQTDEASREQEIKFLYSKLNNIEDIDERTEIYNKINELEEVEDYTLLQKAFTSYGAGTTATLLESLGTLKMLEPAKGLAKQIGVKAAKKELYKQPVRFGANLVGSTLAGLKSLPKNLGVETLEEVLTEISHNALDVTVLNENKSIFEGVNKDFLASTAVSSFGIMAPRSAGNMFNIVKSEFRTKGEIFDNQKLARELIDLNESTTPENSKELRGRKRQLLKKLALSDAISLHKLRYMTADQIEEVADINRQMRQVNGKFSQLGGLGDLGEAENKRVKKQLENEYSSLTTARQELLDAKQRSNTKKAANINKALGTAAQNSNASFYYGVNDFYNDLVMTQMGDGDFISIKGEQEEGGIKYEDLDKQLAKYKGKMVKVVDDKTGKEVEVDAFEYLKENVENNSFNAAQLFGDIIVNQPLIDRKIASEPTGTGAQYAAISPLEELFHLSVAQKGIKFDSTAENAVLEAENILKEKRDLGVISEEDYNGLNKRFDQYRGKDSKDFNAEEFIAQMNNAISLGAINRSDLESAPSFKKFLNNTIRSTFGDMSWMLKLENSDDVFNLVKNFQSDVSKGVTFQAPEREELKTSLSEDIQNELEALEDSYFDGDIDEYQFEQRRDNLDIKLKQAEKTEKAAVVKQVETEVVKDVDIESTKKPTVKKETSDKESKPKKVYNNENLIETIKSKDTSSREKAAAEADLVESFDTMALNAIKYDTRKGDYDRTEVRDYLRVFFPTILKSYNPSEAKFSTWVYNNIAPKAQQTYEKFKKIADKSLDAEAGTAGSVREAVADTSTTTEVATDKTSRKIKPIELVRNQESKNKYREAIKNIVESGEVSIDKSTFGNLKDLATEVTAEIFDIPVLKVTDPADNLTYKDVIVDDSNINKIKKYYPEAKVGMVIKSESSKIQDVIKSMGTDLFKLLPPENVSPELATVDAQAYKPVKGTGLKIPSSLMKVFYEATGKRSKGVTSQTAIKRLKPGLTYEQFLKDLGIVKGQPNTYDRAIGQRLKAITTLFGKLATNTEVRQLEGVTDVQKQNIEAGKSDIQFSKSSKDLLNKFNLNYTEIRSKLDVDNYIENMVKPLINVFNSEDYKLLNRTVLQFRSKSLGGNKIVSDYLRNKLSKLNLPNRVTVGRTKPSSTIGNTVEKFEKSLKSGKINKYNKRNSEVFDKMWNDINDIVSKDRNMAVPIMYFLENSINEATNPHRMGAPIIGYQVNAGKLYYEHAVQSQLSYLSLMESILDPDKNFKSEFEKIKENYKIIAISESSNDKLNKAGYALKMPKDWKNWYDRYFNKKVASIDGGINPNELINIKGGTFADGFGINNKGGKISKEKIALNKSIIQASKSNNNMLPKSQKLKGDFTNDQVLDKMRELDSKQREAQISFSKTFNLDKDFNDILENKTGIAAEKTYGKVKAEVVGASKGKFDFFIAPSAEDFVGLLYKTLGKGKKGDAQMAWYKTHLLDPFARAMNNVSADRNSLGRDFKALKKDLKIVPKDLKKRLPGEYFTKEQAIRVYIWEQTGADIPGLSEADQKTLVDIVKDNTNLVLFANEIMKLNKGIAFAKPSENWVSGTITTDLIEGLNSVKRKQYLELWQQNVDIIFSEKNLNKLEAAYGKSYRYSIEGTLERMKTGRNRTFGTDSLTGRFLDWINGTTGAIMFFNTRSAVLQTISAANFINFQDNNVFAASKAFANQKQYWSDFKMLFNSDFLVERRDGLKLNVQESDIADIAKERGARGVIGRILKLGFTPTQLADSFAIAAGGSTFYRNRLNKLIKEGMDPLAAKKQAMRDFRETAEESQQSSRPDKISQQQAGPLGRTVLAFANTPAQYARLMKKAASDIKNGRGDFKTNVSKIMYYGFVQNLIFNTLTNALFAIEFGEDEEEESKKYVSVANGMADSILRGIGVSGAIVSVLKNAALTFVREDKKKNPNYEKITDDLLRISPPIASKISKFKSASRSYKWDKKEMGEKGFSLDNPAYLAGANVVSAATNLPLDRVIKKMDHVRAASNSELETYKRIFLLAGWSKWDLGIKEPKKSKKKNGKFGGGGGFGSGGKF